MFLLILALSATVVAQEPPPSVAPVLTQEQDAPSLMAEAKRRLVVGDYEGAAITAREVLALENSHPARPTYLLAMALEFDDHLEEALSLYDRLLTHTSDPSRAQDVQFRRATTLGKMGQFEQALLQLDALNDAARSPSDQVKISVLRGLWLLETKRGEEEGLGLIRSTLEAAAPIDAPDHQAMALARLVELASNESKSIVFKGGKRKKGKRLQTRAALVGVATEQLVPMIQLDSPRWTLPAFLDVGEAYEAFGDAMLAESKVRGLNADQRLIYEEERDKQVVGVYVKASRYLDRGAQYAEISNWVGPETEALQQGISRIQAKVEQLDPL